MDGKILNECSAYKLRVRNEAITNADNLKNYLHEKFPEIKSIDARITTAFMRVMDAAQLFSKADFEKRIDEIKNETNELYKKRSEILEENNIKPNYDEPVFECIACLDTGYLGYERCDCMKALYAEALYRSSGLGSALKNCNFNNFNINLYMGEIKEGLHPRDVMESTLVRARAYAQNFNSESGNLLLVGGTGLGKTHLSAAIAEVIINKGYTVIYETAQKLVNDIRQNQFGETDIDIDKYRQCDLLIIDDLGTEVKTEYNISIINEIINNRIVNNKSMIISTNLDNKKINEIYSARIYSRLLGEFKPLMFLGKDIRLIKKTL